MMYLISVDHFDNFLLRSTDDVLDCIEAAAKGVCGEAAAKHSRQIERLYFQPREEFFLCPIGKSNFRITSSYQTSNTDFINI